MILDVYLYDQLTGYLYTDSKYGLSFEYVVDAKYPISISLPLSAKPYRTKAVEPFFSGLFPDGEIRYQLARNAHVSEKSIIGLLDNYGKEIAGAVVILRHGENYPVRDFLYKEVSEQELGERIRNMATNNLLLWGNDIRLSLAGAQNKVPLYYKNNKWFVPLNNAPSNCILKPNVQLAENEYVITRLAKLCNINVPTMEIYSFDGESAIVSKRYDRKELDNGSIVRLQQEDFCQASSTLPEFKYENEGGVGIDKSIELISKNSSMPILDLKAFLEVIVFNYIVGNCDGHCKNYSFLYGYPDKSTIRLAPFYDLLSTTVYPNFSRSMAMKVGKERRIDRIRKEDFYSINGIGDKTITNVISSISKAFIGALASFKASNEHENHKSFIDILEKDVTPRLNLLI